MMTKHEIVIIITWIIVITVWNYYRNSRNNDYDKGNHNNNLNKGDNINKDDNIDNDNSLSKDNNINFDNNKCKNSNPTIANDSNRSNTISTPYSSWKYGPLRGRAALQCSITFIEELHQWNFPEGEARGGGGETEAFRDESLRLFLWMSIVTCS